MVEELVRRYMQSRHPQVVTCQSSAVVSSIEEAHCVLVFEQNEQNAIKLRRAIAESGKKIPGNNESTLAQCSPIK